MIKIAICDDERELREATAARLREYFAEEALIAPFESGEALLRAVREENCRYQLAVLDIELGEMNGIAVGEALNRLLPTCQIIYLTGYLDYAPDAYATRHTYYVYRPTMEKHLPLALQKAMTALAEAENGQLVLPQKGEQLVLEKQTILYMERRLRVTKLYLADGQCVTTGLSAVPQQLCGEPGPCGGVSAGELPDAGRDGGAHQPRLLPCRAGAVP